MQLDEETSSAIAEIGNLCIAGGSNEISKFSDEIVDISVVDAYIKTTEEIMLEVDAYDDCKTLIKIKISGDVVGEFMIQFSNDIIETTVGKFPKLENAGKENNKCLAELSESFFVGFSNGMAGMTGLEVKSEGKSEVLEDIDFSNFPQKVLCYNSVISVGDDRIDFNVFFFSDAEVLIPKVLESLGM